MRAVVYWVSVSICGVLVFFFNLIRDAMSGLSTKGNRETSLGRCISVENRQSSTLPGKDLPSFLYLGNSNSILNNRGLDR